jgi:hypothetical protein
MQRRLPGMRPDYLIQQREIQEKKIADATEYDQKMKIIGINTTWSEKNQKFQVQNAKRRNEQRMRSEIENTYEEIKMRRRVRLQELYVLEMDMYEKELAAKGLSIVKER